MHLLLKTHDNIPLKHWNWQFTHSKRWYNAYYDLEPYICSFCILTHNMIQQTSDYVWFYCNAGNRWRDTISRWNRRVGNPWVSSNNNINIHAHYYFLVPLCVPLIMITLVIYLSFWGYVLSLWPIRTEYLCIKGLQWLWMKFVCQESTTISSF